MKCLLIGATIVLIVALIFFINAKPTTGTTTTTISTTTTTTMPSCSSHCISSGYYWGYCTKTYGPYCHLPGQYQCKADEYCCCIPDCTKLKCAECLKYPSVCEVVYDYSSTFTCPGIVHPNPGGQAYCALGKLVDLCTKKCGEEPYRTCGIPNPDCSNKEQPQGCAKTYHPYKACKNRPIPTTSPTKPPQPTTTTTTSPNGTTTTTTNASSTTTTTTTPADLRPYFKDLSFDGDENYFNIYWSVSFEQSVFADLAINCSLNDRQSCNSLQYSSSNGGCTIQNPQYNFDKINTVKCTVYNPDNPSLSSTKTSEFYSIDFKTWVGASFGQAFTLGEHYIPINVKNLGLLTDKYYVDYEIISGSNFIYSELPYNYTENIRTNEVKFVNLKMSLFSANSVTIKFCVNSTLHPQYCSYDNNMEKKCCQTIEIKGMLMSMPDITVTEIFQLLFLSLIVLLLKS